MSWPRTHGERFLPSRLSAVSFHQRDGTCGFGLELGDVADLCSMATSTICIVQIAVVVARREHEWKPVIDAGRHRTVPLLYSSHDTEHNNAVALEAVLEAHLPKKKPRKYGMCEQEQLGRRNRGGQKNEYRRS
jgi:hypothetical protein